MNQALINLLRLAMWILVIVGFYVAFLMLLKVFIRSFDWDLLAHKLIPQLCSAHATINMKVL